MTIPAPLALLAELTHRCPLRCPYCSNPVELERRSGELGTGEWVRVLGEAKALGVLQVHLSGGEPTARRDLEEIVAACARLGLYSNLITSGIGVTRERLAALSQAGLDHVQLSVQGASADVADTIGGMPGAHARKLAFAGAVAEIGLPLTLNAVVHRANLHEIEAIVALAADLGARRVEIAHVQYLGWALENRSMLLPTREQALAAVALVERLRDAYAGRLVIDAVTPDYHARYPKPCMGGWGKLGLNVTPAGLVLPCHAAQTIPGLEFWSVRERALGDIWQSSPAFNAFRGDAWMKEPCRSCERKTIDFGGCRCQAMAIAGDPAAADPVCRHSPHRSLVDAAIVADEAAQVQAYAYREYRRT